MIAPNRMSMTGAGEPTLLNRKVNFRSPLVLKAEPDRWVIKYLYSAGLVPITGVWRYTTSQLEQN